MQQILIIEDDKNIQKLLHINLSQEGFRVIEAFDGIQGLARAEESKPDLIILDINLPKMKGVEVCRQLKINRLTSKIPVIMLTVKKDEIDRVLGFEVGADDYVTKPFSVRELILRVKAVLRRRKEEGSESRLSAGEIALDESSFEVKVNKKLVTLTATEFRLLKYFLINKERILSRDALLNNVWGYDSEIDTRTVDAHIKSLRKKLRTKAVKIATIIGMGYKFTENV
ncbi:MAG: response regulator [Nitrospirae bacterium]|nr:response regulator [Nitrospirota bacterium]